MTCPKCNTELIPVQKKDSVSAAGILGALLFIAGLPFLFFDLLIGAVLMILALIVSSVGRGKHLEMICPQCKKTISKVAL